MSMLSDVICSAFQHHCGKWQVRKEDPKAFQVEFRTRTDHGKEEGYRHLELLIYGPMNYVQVWVRRTWDVIPLDDMCEDDDGEMVPKQGKKYQKGASEWELKGEHDSCWRDAVDRVLREYEKDITGFDRGDDWFKLVPVSSVPDKTTQSA